MENERKSLNELVIKHERGTDSTEILEFLKSISADVFPPLDSRVDLTVYAKKISEFAECLTIRIDSRIAALSAFYCNDLETLTAYLTIIGVCESLRGTGAAKNLLNETIGYAKAKGMQRLSLETHEQNVPAFRLYEGFGFKLVRKAADGAVFMEYGLR